MPITHAVRLLPQVQSAQSLVKLLANIPAAAIVQQVGRRPLLIGGTGMEVPSPPTPTHPPTPVAAEAVAMAGMGMSTSVEQMVLSMALAGLGGTAMITGATNYLSDISTPKNRSQTNAPLQITALAGVAMGPAVGGWMADAFEKTVLP